MLTLHWDMSSVERRSKASWFGWVGLQGQIQRGCEIGCLLKACGKDGFEDVLCTHFRMYAEVFRKGFCCFLTRRRHDTSTRSTGRSDLAFLVLMTKSAGPQEDFLTFYILNKVKVRIWKFSILIEARFGSHSASDKDFKLLPGSIDLMDG